MLSTPRRWINGFEQRWIAASFRMEPAALGAILPGPAPQDNLGTPKPALWFARNADELDCVFGAQNEFVRLERYYQSARDALSFAVFDGGHEFCPADDGIRWVLERL